ncbi:MAG: O-antigen ligase family protein [Proteobacteria bacterium]|nr:O-antigen ligase family protein [Pseudomonadota bacterium]
MQSKYSNYLFLISFCSVFLTLAAGGRIVGSTEIFTIILLIPTLYFLFINDYSSTKQSILAKKLLNCFLILFVISIFQLLPLPLSLLKIFAAPAFDAYQNVSAEQLFISVSPHLTINALVWMFTLGIVAYTLTKAPVYPANRTNWIQTSCNLVEDNISATLEYLIIFTGLLTAYVALAHYLFSIESLFGLINFDYLFRYTPRAHFPLTNPNHLAFLLEFTLPFVYLRFFVSCLDYFEKNLSDFVKRKRKQTLIFWFFNTIVLLVTLFISMSKAGIFLSLLGAAYFLWIVVNKYKVKLKQQITVTRADYYNRLFILGLILALFIISIAVLILVVLGDPGQDSLTRRFERAAVEGVDSGRVVFSQISIEALKQSPLFGYGLGCWHLAVAPFKTKQIAMWRLDYAHSDFLQLAVELGIFALFAVLYGVYYIFKSILRDCKERKENTLAYLREVAYLLSFSLPIIHANFEFPFHAQL